MVGISRWTQSWQWSASINSYCNSLCSRSNWHWFKQMSSMVRRWFSFTHFSLLLSHFLFDFVFLRRIFFFYMERCLINTYSFLFINYVPHPRCRYLEVRYHRPEEIHKGRLIESRVENIIVFLPDIAAACMPTSLEWEETISTYKQKCDEELAEELNEINTPVHISSLISLLFLSVSLFLSLRSRQQFHDKISNWRSFFSFFFFFFFFSIENPLREEIISSFVFYTILGREYRNTWCLSSFSDWYWKSSCM